MKTNSNIPLATLRSLTNLTSAALAAVVLLALPVAGFAQETTAGIRGTVSAPDGSPVVNASIRVTDTRTSASRMTSTSSSGSFTMGGLRVGGPYVVTISSANYTDTRVTDVYMELGETLAFDVALSAEALEEIIVTAEALQAVQVAVGPSSTFNLDDLQNLPAINRDIRDVIRIDPRVYIDQGFVDSVQCLGANPRFNSLTVDGIRMNDNFGLNSNGFPTQRQPFPFDAIQNVAIELAPFDVQYGGFTACNINAVTKSGGNEFSGSVFFDYTDDSYIGDKLQGDPVPPGDFDEKRYGFSIGGPIVQDKLFFFAAYEKAETASTFDRCGADAVCGRPVLGVSQAQIDRIADISRTLYNYDPGDPISTSPVEDEKYLLKLDWQINDSHRAAATYSYNDGFSLARPDSDDDEFEFSKHFYEQGAELNAYTGQLYSDWTDNFSTEFRIGYSELDNRQISTSEPFGEVRIETYHDVDCVADPACVLGDPATGYSPDRANVFLGRDDSRQANDLDYDTTNLKLAGTYTYGDHVISGGYEFESVDIFNLFLQHTVGEYRFDEENTDILGNTVGCSSITDPDGCIDQFEAFSPDDIYIGNANTLNPSDAAALFEYTVHTLYVQDEFTIAVSNLTLVAGLRYDWYDSSDLPSENADFIARTGFSNSQNFDGESLIQPRFGFTWDATDTLSLRGGFGLFSGGNPNVWLGNNYQNDGFTQVQAREGDEADPANPVNLDELNREPNRSLLTVPLGVDGNGVPLFDPPTNTLNFITGGANTGVNAVDPNFDPPSNWKFSLGGTWVFDLPGIWGQGYTLNGDVIYTQAEDSAIIVDDTLVQIGAAPDGRPIYYPTDKSVAGCEADPLSNPAGCSRLFNADYILTNVVGDDAEQLSFSVSLSKAYDFGFEWTLGYAYTESDEVSPMTSSTAGSNFFNIAVADPNNPGLRPSNYEIPHRVILNLAYKKAFFGDYDTRINVYGSWNQGRPFSYTFRDQTMFIQGPFFNPDDDRSLLYMPSGPSDPNVVFDPGFDTDAFFAFAAGRDLTAFGGGIVPRNAFHSSYWTKFDLRISQQLPGFGESHRTQAYLVIENFGNLLNDDWGTLHERGFPRTNDIVEASIDDGGTPTDFTDDVYVFETFNEGGQGRVSSASLWAIRIGFNYSF